MRLDAATISVPKEMQVAFPLARSRAGDVVRFGVFTVDLQAGELYRSGRKIKLQDKPFQILAMLLRRPGELVTREELRNRLWSSGTFVDFDHSIKTAVRKIREALGDSAQSPRFVETLARRGYRFIAPMEKLGRSYPPQAGLRTGRVKLAVLPFENLSGDNAQDYLSDGLTEEMIAQLGQVHPHQLGVIARTSAMRYKHTAKGIDQIGDELRVDHILEGSVRRAGDRVRITAQLIQVSDQTHVWANSYERDLRDILTLQSQVAQAITHEIRLRLAPRVVARMSSARPINPEAYEAYLKGRYYWNIRSEEGIKKGLEYFRQAVEKDPTHALGYSGMADSYRILAVYGFLSPREAMPKAKAAAMKALEIDDSLAEARISLAAVMFRFEWDWVNSESEFQRAIELNPSYAEGHRMYAVYLEAVGRFNEAIAETRRAQELDPLSPTTKTALGWALYFARRYEEAIRECLNALQTEPNLPRVRYFLGCAYAERRMFREAVAELERAVELSNRETPYLAGLGNVYAVSGNRKEAYRLLTELIELSNQRYVSPYDVAKILASLGKNDQALHWLEKAYGIRSTRLVFLKVDPIFDCLHSEPQFRGLLQRIGLSV